MPLRLFLRNGIWNYRGTIGPAERRSRLRGSCKTEDRDTAARQIAEIEASYWKGHFDGPGSILTFQHAAALYRKAGKSTQYLAKIEDHFKNRLVKSITAGHIRQMSIDLFPKCSNATRNRQGIVPARAVINFAAEMELCSPIKVRLFKAEHKVKDPATLEWVNAFVANANPHVGALCLFMFMTGARIGEALALQWKDIDMAERTALIRQTKVGVERKANLPAPLIAALANLERIPDRGVFGYRHRDDIWRVWDGAIEKAGIKYLSPHSCRHGFATGLLRRGVDVVTVAHLGGWKTAALVLKTYGHAIRDPQITDVLTRSEHTQEMTAGKHLKIV